MTNDTYVQRSGADLTPNRGGSHSSAPLASTITTSSLHLNWAELLCNLIRRTPLDHMTQELIPRANACAGDLLSPHLVRLIITISMHIRWHIGWHIRWHSDDTFEGIFKAWQTVRQRKQKQCITDTNDKLRATIECFKVADEVTDKWSDKWVKNIVNELSSLCERDLPLMPALHVWCECTSNSLSISEVMIAHNKLKHRVWSTRFGLYHTTKAKLGSASIISLSAESVRRNADVLAKVLPYKCEWAAH